MNVRNARPPEQIALLSVLHFLNDIQHHNLCNLFPLQSMCFSCHYLYFDNEVQPIMKNNLYGTYYFITFYKHVNNGYDETVILVEFWYETELKENIHEYEVKIV